MPDYIGHSSCGTGRAGTTPAPKQPPTTVKEVGLDTQVTLAALYALASAVGFALSTSLQHRVAGGAPSGGGVLGVFRFVLTRKVWILGATIGFLSLILHALALNNGAIALVQPIMISGVVLAVIFRAALDREVPPRSELAGVTLTAAALGCFLVVANPTAESVSDDRQAFIFWLVGLGGIGSLVLIANRIANRYGASFLLGCASGVCFGLTAGLLKMLSNDFGADGIMGVLTSWHLVAQVSTGLLGIAINQRAYQLAPLAVSMPVLNVVNVLVALTFGLIVFEEFPARHPVGIAVLALCLVLMGVGLRMLATVHPDAPKSELPDASTEADDTQIGNQR